MFQGPTIRDYDVALPQAFWLSVARRGGRGRGEADGRQRLPHGAA